MRIEDRFTVSLPVAEAWKVFLDVERIAPCMPGAQLQEITEDEYRGIVKVKLGAITAQFKGAVRFAEVDEAERRVVLRAQGREIRGQGNASATVTATLSDAAGNGTEVAIDTDLSITGRVAQFGRGVLADVSSKLLADFARCIEANLVQTLDNAAPSEAVEPSPRSEAGLETKAEVRQPEPPRAAEPVTPPQRRLVQSQAAEPIDLLAVAGSSVARRALPAAIVVVLFLLAVTKDTAKRWALSLLGAALVATDLATAEQQR
jgi:carbon monoxide dehydrogenase subunit G